MESQLPLSRPHSLLGSDLLSNHLLCKLLDWGCLLKAEQLIS